MMREKCLQNVLFESTSKSLISTAGRSLRKPATMSRRCSQKCSKVTYKLFSEIYQMNMGPKGHNLPFGESDIGESMIDGPDSIIGGPMKPSGNKNN